MYRILQINILLSGKGIATIKTSEGGSEMFISHFNQIKSSQHQSHRIKKFGRRDKIQEI